MTVQRADTFTRANVSSGWGTATDGNAWNVGAGSSTLSVTSDEGIIASSSASSFLTLGGSLATADGEALVRIARLDTTSTIGAFLRWTDANNFYLSFLDGSGNLKLYKKVAGTATVINALTFSTTASTFYWMRFRVQGTTLEQRVWQDGTAEPSAWTYSTTDSDLSGSGGSANSVGLYGYSNGLNNEYDSYTVDDLVSALTGTVTLKGQGAFVAAGSAPSSASAALKGQGAFIASGHEVVSASVALKGRGAFAASQFTPGTGIGDLIASTQSESWSGGPAGSPGTATVLTYTDTSSDGWAVEAIPTYGGMVASVWREVAAGVQGISQTALTTNAPDGRMTVDVQSSGGVYTSSESTPFTLTELAPTGTAFRRYYRGSYGPDANGLNWQATICVYPGDPGFTATRFDLINPSGSAVALNASSDSIEIALIQGMQVADSTWNYLNGGYGTVGGANVTPWPVASANGNPVSADPDYIYIVPASGGSTTIGQVTVKQQPTTAYTPAWSSPQLAVLVDSVHLKIKVFGDLASIPASSTSTFYFLNALRRNLVAADAIAIAADYLAPGTPTATAGSYTSYSYDEGAWVFAASALNTLSTTLDFSPAHVSARYKPRLKITGWTGGAPQLTWGGASLRDDVDYRHTVDAANSTLYVQLYYDVVASGATTGQRNNAALAIQPVQVSGAVTLHGQGGFSAAGAFETIIASVSLKGQGAFASSGHEIVTGHPVILSGQGAFLASGHAVITGHAATLSGQGAFAASGHEAVSGQATLVGQGAFLAAGSASTTRSVTLSGRGAFSASGYETIIASVRLAGQGAFSASVAPPPPPSGVSVALASVGPVGVSVSEQ